MKYILWAVGAFIIIAGTANGEAAAILVGIIFIVIGSFSTIKNSASDFSSSKAQDDLLKLKSLLDQGIVTKEEYNKRSEKLKKRL